MRWGYRREDKRSRRRPIRGIPIKDAVAEVDTLDAVADDAGVAFELGELTTIDAGADIEVA